MRIVVSKHTNYLVRSTMFRPTTRTPERSDARERLLQSARDVIRRQVYAGTTVDDICEDAGVTKGALLHHFKSKEELGVAAAQYWADTTAALFAQAPYHAHSDPLERVLAYPDFRKSILRGEIAEFTCLVGTMTQEVYESSPAVRDACATSIFGHAATLESDIVAAMRARGVKGEWTAASLGISCPYGGDTFRSTSARVRLREKVRDGLRN
jgi:TetR/AcrR family transcriptional repressor of nem operon